MTLDAETLARIDAAASRIADGFPPLTTHQRGVVAAMFAGTYDDAVSLHLGRAAFVAPAPAPRPTSS